MNNESLKNHPLIQKLLQLDGQYPDRNDFHENVKPLLLEMGKDKEFIKAIIRRNFDDPGYLGQEWSLYNIPYLHVYETDGFVLKIHLFPAVKNYQPGLAAHAVHHHNNYMLTTNAFFGSGYESLLFGKDFYTNENTLETKLTIKRHFHQRDWNPSMVDAWEPHLVFMPESLSATMLIWTPEKKRTTDALRNVSVLKAIKKPLRKIIQFFGMESRFGIAKKHTYQFYPHAQNNVMMAIEEEEYFSVTKAAKGDAINNYCMQILCGFIQQGDYVEKDYLQAFLNKTTPPDYFKFWVKKLVDGEKIEEVFHREEINIPQKKYTIEDIRRCCESAEK